MSDTHFCECVKKGHISNLEQLQQETCTTEHWLLQPEAEQDLLEATSWL